MLPCTAVEMACPAGAALPPRWARHQDQPRPDALVDLPAGEVRAAVRPAPGRHLLTQACVPVLAAQPDDTRPGRVPAALGSARPVGQGAAPAGGGRLPQPRWRAEPAPLELKLPAIRCSRRSCARLASAWSSATPASTARSSSGRCSWTPTRARPCATSSASWSGHACSAAGPCASSGAPAACAQAAAAFTSSQVAVMLATAEFVRRKQGHFLGVRAALSAQLRVRLCLPIICLQRACSPGAPWASNLLGASARRCSAPPAQPSALQLDLVQGPRAGRCHSGRGRDLQLDLRLGLRQRAPRQPAGHVHHRRLSVRQAVPLVPPAARAHMLMRAWAFDRVSSCFREMSPVRAVPSRRMRSSQRPPEADKVPPRCKLQSCVPCCTISARRDGWTSSRWSQHLRPAAR